MPAGCVNSKSILRYDDPIMTDRNIQAGVRALLQLYLEEDFDHPNIAWLLVLMRSVISLVVLYGCLHIALQLTLEFTGLGRRMLELWGEVVRELLRGFYAAIAEGWRASCVAVGNTMRLCCTVVDELRGELRALLSVCKEAWMEVWSKFTRENVISMVDLSVIVYVLQEFLDAIKKNAAALVAKQRLR